ncbi:MAG: hypothetical protein MR582_02660 [Campylobacter sp.]|nr:hypothetical protein [Campylobacter sp.]
MKKNRGIDFEKIASPDATGTSRKIYIEKLPPHLNITNGSDFSRANSYLDRKYYLEKKYIKKDGTTYTVNTRKQNQREGIGKGKLISIKLDGLKNQQ